MKKLFVALLLLSFGCHVALSQKAIKLTLDEETRVREAQKAVDEARKTLSDTYEQIRTIHEQDFYVDPNETLVGSGFEDKPDGIYFFPVIQINSGDWDFSRGTYKLGSIGDSASSHIVLTSPE